MQTGERRKNWPAPTLLLSSPANHLIIWVASENCTKKGARKSDQDYLAALNEFEALRLDELHPRDAS